MSCYNQNDYAHVPYPHAQRPKATVKSSGCGVCCASMVIEGLLGQRFPPQQSAAFAIQVGARASGGTDMARLASGLAERFGIRWRAASSAGILTEALEKGAWVIANVGGDRKGYVGLFSNGGHYVTVRKMDGGRLVVWDPGYYKGKFEKPGRRGRVTLKGDDIYVDIAALEEDCRSRAPRYYIFEGERMTQEQFDKMMEAYLASRGQLPPSQWAEKAVEKAVSMAITDGSAPRGFATREEVAAMLIRMGDIQRDKK